jgi:hypothetical protein
MGKTNFFLDSLPFSHWEILAVYRNSLKSTRNEFTTHFEQKFTTC